MIDLLNELSVENAGKKLIEANRYWSKKRILFNILVGLTGLMALITSFHLLSIPDYIGIIIWGLIANGLYSFGYVLESFIIAKSNGSKDLQSWRDILFWFGTMAYVFVTFASAFLYSAHASK